MSISSFFGKPKSSSKETQKTSPTAAKDKKKKRRIIASDDDEDDDFVQETTIKKPKVVSPAKSKPKAPSKETQRPAVDPSAFFSSANKIERLEKPVKTEPKPQQTTVKAETEKTSKYFQDATESVQKSSESPAAMEVEETKIEIPVKAEPVAIVKTKVLSPQKKEEIIPKQEKHVEVKQAKTTPKTTPTRKKHTLEEKTSPSGKRTKSSPQDSLSIGRESDKMEVEKEEAETSEKKRSYDSHYAQYLAKKASSGPKALGSKEVPVGEPNCLQGLTFVFTGELSSISREDAADLVRKYAGRVTGAPSSKTSYLVVGDDPGESKITKAKSIGLKMLNEDELFELIRSSKGQDVAPPTTKPATKKETLKQAAQPKKVPIILDENRPPGATLLWTDKYRPKSYSDIIGNKSNVEKLGTWLKKWSPHKDAKPAGKDDITQFKAVLISGPPGIGKTTAAHLVAKLEGWDAIEMNASDTRSKKAIDEHVAELTGCHTMTEYFARGGGDAKGKSAAPHLNKRQVLIMDEVDGMSAGDRGGTTQLISLIKKTKIPIICICNDRQSPKIRSLANHCYDMRFRRPTDQQVEQRLRYIAQSEGLQLQPNVVHMLVHSTQADVRQILNLLSTYRLKSDVLTFDKSKEMQVKPTWILFFRMKTADKNVTMTPWDAMSKLISPQTFRSSSLNDKLDCYFSDFSLMPLMMQENYVRCAPQLAKELAQGNEKKQQLETLNCISNAADSISESDLLDSSLRGWLGQNSKQGKNYRLLKELEAKMKTTLSGDKEQIRELYIPILADLLTNPLKKEGKEGIAEVIALMDHYYLNREDFDSILELSLGDMNKDLIMKKIPTAVKTAFTSTYNKSNHPVLFMPSAGGKAQKATGKKEALPDLEEVQDNDDFEEAADEDDDKDDDVKVDKLIKQKTSKGKAKAKAGGSGTRKKK